MIRSFTILGLFAGVITAGCLDLQTSENAGGAGGTSGSSGESSSSSGSSGGGAPVLIREWSATEPQELDYLLPDWLKIECTTIARTSQWSPNTLQGPYGANVARPRNIGKGWGLSVESRRRNKIKNSDGWNGGNWDSPAPIAEMNMSFGHPDPMGAMGAVRFNSTGDDRSPTTNVPQGYASVWIHSPSAPPQANVVLDNGGSLWTFLTVSLDDSWQRYVVGVGDGRFFLDTVGNAMSKAPSFSSNSTIYAFGAQHETDGNGAIVQYPSSYIPNGGMDRDREADRLYSNVMAELMPGGYFHVILTFAPNYASTEATAGYHNLLHVNAGNGLRFDFNGGRLMLESTSNAIAGPTSGVITWDRDQTLTVEAKSTPAGRSLSLSGATTGNFEVSDAGDRPWPIVAELQILGDNNGAQECADLRSIGFWEPK